MKLVLNGEQRTVADVRTVADLLADRNLAGRPAAVEVNGEVISKAQHDSHLLRDGDRVEIVTLVGGG